MGERVLLFTDDRMLAHSNGPGHPERPERLTAIRRRLDGAGGDGVEWAPARPATGEEVCSVHDPAYVEFIDRFRGHTGRLDADTGVAPGSVEAAYLAAGAAVRCVEVLAAGAARCAFALVRPPGHHAEQGRAMGFCLFNNIAIAAAVATARLGFSRVLVVDWDVHHGNGTQQAFYERSDVFFFGSHRFPFWPGTGRLDERGAGPGLGCTVNVPLPAGVGDDVVVPLYRALLPEIAQAFAPDLVLVSAGYDAHRDDPLGGLDLTDAGFSALCGVVRDIAERHAGGRLALFLEGGYDLRSLADGVLGSVRVLAGDAPEECAVAADGAAAKHLIAAVRRSRAP